MQCLHAGPEKESAAMTTLAMAVLVGLRRAGGCIGDGHTAVLLSCCSFAQVHWCTLRRMAVSAMAIPATTDRPPYSWPTRTD